MTWRLRKVNNTLARKTASTELKKILEECDLLSGISLTATKLESTTKVLYWRTAITSQKAFEKDTYIIYTITSSDIATIADNKVKTREVIIALDIYTIKDLNTREIVKLVSNLEDKLVEYNWEVTYEEELYDNDNKLHHIPLTISKNF